MQEGACTASQHILAEGRMDALESRSHEAWEGVHRALGRGQVLEQLR